MLLLALFPLVWCSVFFGAMLINQFEVQSKLEGSHSLQTLRLNTKEVKWIKNNKEILVDGKYFDVKHAEIEGSMTVFAGFFDTEEDELSAKISIVFKTNEHRRVLLSNVLYAMFFLGAPIENCSSITTPDFLTDLFIFPHFKEKLQLQFEGKAYRPPAFA